MFLLMASETPWNENNYKNINELLRNEPIYKYGGYVKICVETKKFIPLKLTKEVFQDEILYSKGLE